MFLDGQNTGLSYMVLLLPFEDSHDLPARRGAFPELSQAGTQPLAAACSPRTEQHYGTAAAGKNHFLCSWLQSKLNAPPREQEAEVDSERSTPERTIFHRWHFSGLSNPSSSSANWSGSFSKTGKRQEGDGANRTSN